MSSVSVVATSETTAHVIASAPLYQGAGVPEVKYRSGSATDMPFTIRTRHSTIAAPVGPLRVTLVLGDTAAAGTAGDCGVTSPLACTVDASRADCE